jgi:hypothetical protein
MSLKGGVMNQSMRFMGVLVSALMLASVTANPAIAQEKGKAAKSEATVKVLLENDKVRVTEATWKPGDETPSRALGVRVTRALKGGTLTRIYPDGKTEKSTYKVGEVKFFEATPQASLKNTGKKEIVLYTVFVK